MENLFPRFLKCGGQICDIRYYLAVRIMLVLYFIILPVAFVNRIYPELLFFDKQKIIFLLPLLVPFFRLVVHTGCNYCLLSRMQDELF